MKNPMIGKSGFFAWPNAKCLSIPVTEQVTTSFVLRRWWITISYHWYRSDQFMCLTLGNFRMSFSHSECAPPRLFIGPLHITIRTGRRFGEKIGEKFEFWKNPKPWEDCLVWKADLRVLTVYYTPKWAREARDHWEKVRREWIKPAPIAYRAPESS